MLLDRYLIREISKPLALISGILVVIFTSYSTTRFLSDAATGTLSTSAVFDLITLKTVIALEVLLPIALYLSVVLALGRLHSDSEITALNAAGVGMWQLLRPVLGLALLLAVVVGGLSLHIRPWAYQTSYQLKARAEATLDVDTLESDRFYVGPSGDYVVFVDRHDPRSDRLRGVFVQAHISRYSRVIFAQHASRRSGTPGGEQVFVFQDGHVYELDRNGSQDRIMGFKRLVLELETPEVDLGYKRKAASNAHLANSQNLADLAELQWRLSTPLSTLLLGVLGVPLSHVAPRRGRYAKLLAAALLYALYYNLLDIARTWLEQGYIGAFPGIWWVPTLLAALLVVQLLR